uniref:Uncharacterized protein n=1 Tax=Megaselia scalaris TaxID=36166 RepID=T1GR52_MEGSC
MFSTIIIMQLFQHLPGNYHERVYLSNITLDLRCHKKDNIASCSQAKEGEARITSPDNHHGKEQHRGCEQFRLTVLKKGVPNKVTEPPMKYMYSLIAYLIKRA